MARDAPVAPSWFDERDINFPELEKCSGAPHDTIRAWHRLILASGAEFGEKFRGGWHFSCRELCAFWMAASLRDLGYPINHVILADIVKFARENDSPDRPFRIGFHPNPAYVLIDAATIYEAAINMMSRVRRLQDA